MMTAAGLSQDIAVFNDWRKVSLLKLATPSVLAASPLRRCSFWQARRQALPVAAHLHLFLSVQIVYRTSSP
jgi:hypothetical protein